MLHSVPHQHATDFTHLSSRNF